MVFTFYKGFSIDVLKSDINLLPDSSSSQMALPASCRSPCVGVGSMFVPWWLPLRCHMDHHTGKDERNIAMPLHEHGVDERNGIFSIDFIRFVCGKRFDAWKLGWDIRLWTAAYSVSNFILAPL
ncbi:hypothetical protein V5N11_025443 [Cardamine amara subsp. amara]|uniref:Uncharacterized protein n=1 Tax=Cardamine amara subsp. amara TaxID=228776 RepID=A0ABD0Z0I4_CARAN